MKNRVFSFHKKLNRRLKQAFCKKKPKIFCIGRNKTGTTSLKKAFEDLGYLVGYQRPAERLAPFYHQRNFKPIIEYCKTARVFQDVPFSWPETYKFLDEAYPDAKFILSVRDSSEQWYDSLVRFHTKRYGRVPEIEDLKKSTYVWKGWSYENFLARRDIKKIKPLDKTTLVKEYEKHNQDVIEYFRDRPNKLLVINLSDSGSYKKFCRFLGVLPLYENFPWENKTSE